MTLYATILAGGSGTRFWPKSRTNVPKQFLALQGAGSLLQDTVERITPLIPPAHTFVVTAAYQRDQTLAQLPAVPAANVLAEPNGRNTAAAIALAASHLAALEPDALMLVLPADHAIADAAAFCACVEQAAAVVQQHDVLMTLGIWPTFAATGYGYIKLGHSLETPGVPQAHTVAQFMEKPAAAAAAEMVASGEYLWNGGIFLWRVETIVRELRRHLPKLWRGIEAYATAQQADANETDLADQYAQLQSISIDYGVLERSDCVGVLPVDFAWSDVGSWRALADLHAADSEGNVVIGHHLGHDTTNVIVYSPEKLVATIGVSNVIIVQTDDVVLICDAERDQDVRELVAMLQQRKQTEYL